jgi:DNA invertase Pin-like site-specific DNA recombinase
VRVSTDEQESGNQLPELRQWAARRGLEVAAEYVVDGASAWKGEHREQLATALADARRGRYDVLLLVWALDRLDREGVESTLGLLRRFHEAGTRVWSLKEPWTETAGPEAGRVARRAIRLDGRRRIQAPQRAGQGWAGPAQGRRQAGRPPGRFADRKLRRRSGYYARWERVRTIVS